MICVGYCECAAAAVFLSGAAHGETGVWLEDVETAAKVDAPTIVGYNLPVVVGCKVVGKFDAERTQVVLKTIEDVDHLGDGFIVFGVGVQNDFQLFRGVVGFFEHLNEINQIVNLIGQTDERVGDFDGVGGLEIVGEEGFVGNPCLIKTDFY